MRKRNIVSTDLRDQVMAAISELPMVDDRKHLSGLAVSEGNDELVRIQYRVYGSRRYSEALSRQLTFLAEAVQRLSERGLVVCHEASAETPWVFGSRELADLERDWAAGRVGTTDLLARLESWESESARGDDDLDRAWELRLLARGMSNQKSCAQLEVMLSADPRHAIEVIDALRDLAGIGELTDAYAPVVARLLTLPGCTGELRELHETHPTWGKRLDELLNAAE